MALIPGLPNEIGLMVLDRVEDRADVASLRLTSSALAVERLHMQWRTVDLHDTGTMVRKLCALLRQPELRRWVRNIRLADYGTLACREMHRWPRPSRGAFNTEEAWIARKKRWEDSLKAWEAEILACISDGVLPADLETLKVCRIIDDHGRVLHEHRQYPYNGALPASVAECICSSVALLCSQIDVLDLSTVPVSYTRSRPGYFLDLLRMLEEGVVGDPSVGNRDFLEQEVNEYLLLPASARHDDETSSFSPWSSVIDEAWEAALHANPETGVRVPRVETLRVDPATVEEGEWFKYRDLHDTLGRPQEFHSFLRTPAKRLDLFSAKKTFWTFHNLDVEGVFPCVEDLRLDPDHSAPATSEGKKRIRRAKRFRSHRLPPHCKKSAEEELVDSVQVYFKHAAPRLKRLHWFDSSSALQWRLRAWRPKKAPPLPPPLAPAVSLLTSLVHLETDLVSLFNSPRELCSSPKRLADLLPASLKVIQLSDVWSRQSEPCCHQARAYRRGLYRNLATLVEVEEQAKRFPDLQYFAIRLPPQEENYRWRGDLDLGKRLVWTQRNSMSGTDPFVVLGEGTGEHDVFQEYCGLCRRRY